MEVMSYLCGLEVEAWESGQDRLAVDTLGLEVRFIKAHLAVWIPEFCADARAASARGFYGRLVDLVHAFVVHEADYVDGIVKQSTPQ